MSVMLAKTYRALKSAGATEDEAREAAEELAGYESRSSNIESRLDKIEVELSMLKWIIGLNFAMSIAILWRVFTL